MPYLAGMVALPSAIAVVLAAYGEVSGAGRWWFVPSDGTLFDVGSDGRRELSLVVLLPAMLVTMWGAWTPWVRLLKVLPVTVRQLNTIMVLTPFVTWSVIWVIGCAAYAMAYGGPAMWRLDLVLGLSGVAALAHAVLLRFQGSTGTFWMVAFSAVVLPRVLEAGLGDRTHAIFAAVGAIATMAAAGLNHATLTQSTSGSVPFRRPQTPFGPPAATPGPR